MEYKSRVYQPERLSLSSSDSSIITSQDSSNPLTYPGFFSQYTINLQTPILNVKSIQLLRASIPLATTSIPDSECTFWYYRLPNDGNRQPVAPAPQYLHCVRLLPSFIPQELATDYQNYGWNQYFVNYTDLVTQLNLATVNDPSAENTYFIPGDITFAVSGLNKISFQGNNAFDGGGAVQFFYLPAGFLDPNVAQAQIFLQNETAIPFNLIGVPGQPYVPPNAQGVVRTLNQRLGFSYTGNYYGSNPFYENCRPLPDYFVNDGSTANLDTTINIANSYANLTYSTNAYIYCNAVSASAYDSAGVPNLLSVVPLNAPTLGIAYYNNVLNNPLTKVVKDLYEIVVVILTDTGLPFLLPDSANVNIELGFTFV